MVWLADGIWLQSLLAISVFTLLALTAGAALGFVKHYYGTKDTNSVIDQINNQLPQSQCGQCGYPGCRPYAEAIAHGEPINKCPPGGEAVIAVLAKLLNRPVVTLNEQFGQHEPKRLAVIREEDCIGCGRCLPVCPVDAILGASQYLHTVIADECTGCDLCLKECPVDCIDMVEATPNTGANRYTTTKLIATSLRPSIKPATIATPVDTGLPIKAASFDFQGGMALSDCTKLSTSTPIKTLPLPPMLKLTITPGSRLLIAAGEVVLKGQPLTTTDYDRSYPQHAPTSGTVLAITKTSEDAHQLQLQPDRHDRPFMQAANVQATDDTLATIWSAGIVGLGGGGFPTANKLATSNIDTLILNCVECDPYISCDEMLIKERPQAVLSGLAILAQTVQPKRIMIAITNTKKHLAEALQAAFASLSSTAYLLKKTNISCLLVPDRFPAGSERQLVQMATGIKISGDKRPIDFGVLTQNVGTAHAIHRAINCNEPLISRIVTLTGQALAYPGNYDVLVGTPFNFLLEQAGLQRDRLDHLLLGGAMNGARLVDLTQPLLPTSHCLIAAVAGELTDNATPSPCIRCGFCANVCPSSLLPQQLHWYAQSKEWSKLSKLKLQDCIECGLCNQVCPSRLPLVQSYRIAKQNMQSIAEDKQRSSRAKTRFQQQQKRLASAQQEKNARRLARLQKLPQNH